MEDKKVEVYTTPQGAKHFLFLKVGYNQYYFKREKGKLHSCLDSIYTSREFANKAWQFYVKNHMKYNRTSKNIEELGEVGSDFKLNKPVETIEE